MERKYGQRYVAFFRESKIFLLLNFFWVGIFLAIGLYAKTGGGDRGHSVGTLFADFFTDTYPLYGFFTNVSEVLWCIALTICSFTYAILASLSREAYLLKRFSFFSSLLLGLFVLDDIFRLTLILKVFIGIPKLVSYLIYGFLLVGYSISFRKFLLSTPYLLLLFSALLLVMSGISDLLPIPGKGTPAMLEDGTKLLAVLNICIFFWTVCLASIRRKLTSNGQSRQI
ncbi:hypothetical protein XM38_014330 [Halomicronema hongdechloris C2206]|uniref:DUF998 domain-containing protein n=1 Tax=Halomicronema hongdechloris C2206 TaxID=1641165 RepID=A0A1Z3HJJ0_9CYAN|nr:hypothetical protein [Halomicronema hongdechloris]ASC70494.1 hypothetical protein XM38_014330 [Halomicronema hongdechloris C2206]